MPATRNSRADASPRTLADAKQRADPAFRDFHLRDSPLFLIVRIGGRYALDMADALRPVGLDLPSWRALMVLHEQNPASVSEIAEVAEVQLSTMTRVVQRLEQRGLVRLARRAGDARVTEVHLSEAGEIGALNGREAASRVFSHLFRDFSAREISALKVMLRRVYGKFDR